MQIFIVAGMTCAQCVQGITRALEKLDPAAQVTVDLQAGKVLVESELSAEKLGEAIEGEGYTLVASEAL